MSTVGTTLGFGTRGGSCTATCLVRDESGVAASAPRRLTGGAAGGVFGEGSARRAGLESATRAGAETRARDESAGAVAAALGCGDGAIAGCSAVAGAVGADVSGTDGARPDGFTRM